MKLADGCMKKSPKMTAERVGGFKDKPGNAAAEARTLLH
jgi:hypothetical protein